MNRKVIFYKYESGEKIACGDATLLAFGIDYEELRDGVGQFSSAIIELPDGSVKNVPVEMIMFK